MSADTTINTRAAADRMLCDVMVDPRHMPQRVAMPGLNGTWRPLEMNIDDALCDIGSLLGQSIGVFDKYNDLTQDQWGALQHLSMANDLLSAVHSTLIRMALVSRE